jgi:SecD/SecF fusion protein
MFDIWYVVHIGLLVFLVLSLMAARRFLKPFFWRITFCLTPLILAGIVASNATHRYLTEGSGFKLGVDLVGGTILVYEVDPTRMPKAEDGKAISPTELGEKLAARLKHRLDPNDLYNVTIRPVTGQTAESTRVEIILPTGGAHRAKLEQEEWQKLIDRVRANPDWAKLQDPSLDATFAAISRGNRADLIDVIRKAGVSVEEAERFINDNYKPNADQKNKDVTSEQIQHFKDLIAQVGSLEFRILANDKDDKEAIKAAKDYLEDPKNKDILERSALEGKPPPGPPPPAGKTTFAVEGKGHFTYSWVEMGKEERFDYHLNNAAANPWQDLLARVRVNWDQLRNANLEAIPEGNRRELMDLIRERTHATEMQVDQFLRDNENKGDLWKRAEQARGKAIDMPASQTLLYSRKCLDTKLTPRQREDKAVEYFLLTRDPEVVQVEGEDKPVKKEITGLNLTSASPTHDTKGRWAVSFKFDSVGASRFYDVTSTNLPEGPEGSDKFKRHLAIILDGQIISAPTINAAIRGDGIIEGNFTQKKVTDFVQTLKSGALPATLKPQPVSENTMGATLGGDTIRDGAYSVGLAFLAILVFMIVYYRFAGAVASVALLANLLLTVAFMVIVNATFTLPGLAGLVLMLGMAVDANVLIYERVREERDRGASLPLAIRNGYDRAFPTIIDTHLSSIFTAIVLYTVGNDQLKGFGISLTAGLIISLFTSLYMTRLLFDLWLAKNWLHKLSMFRLFSRPNIDFMGIRYYWFTATILLTIIGITVFVVRLPQDLNIDFNGGTLYEGRLVTPTDIGTLRDLLEKEENQKKHLHVPPDGVEEVSVSGEEGNVYNITYVNEDGSKTKRAIHFPNPSVGATPDVRQEEIRERASQLPDISVEQIFRKDDTGTESRRFNVRTTEKAPELVQAAISRLLGERLEKTKLTVTMGSDGKEALLSFTDPNKKDDNGNPLEAYASPAQVNTLLKREFRSQNITQTFTVSGEGKQDESGAYTKIRVVWGDAGIPKEKLKRALDALTQEFQERPVPDRLENFDKQLAEETQARAMYAILASWAAILLYLWFRFGSWTFGLAAVLCLIHDLFFTMGIIAFCHYLYGTGFGTALAIQDFKIDLPTVAALLTLVGYSVNDTIVVFDRIREVRGKNPELTPQMINDSVNQTLSRTLLTSFATWLVVIVLYVAGGEGVHLFSFVMVVGVIVGTYSSIYIASPLLLIFGEGRRRAPVRQRQEPVGAGV